MMIYVTKRKHKKNTSKGRKLNTDRVRWDVRSGEENNTEINGAVRKTLQRKEDEERVELREN